MNPKPHSYLTPNGVKIFNQLLKHLEDVDLKAVDSFELSALANTFDIHQRAAVVINRSDDGYTQKTPNGYRQITPEFSIYKDTFDRINKGSDKFGLNPAAREKIKIFMEKEKNELEGL